VAFIVLTANSPNTFKLKFNDDQLVFLVDEVDLIVLNRLTDLNSRDRLTSRDLRRLPWRTNGERADTFSGVVFTLHLRNADVHVCK
jgi:hypothetical protein